jgi:hypothetical protein
VEKITQQETLCYILLTKYHSGDHVKKTDMAGHIARMGDSKGAYRSFVRKPEERR